MDELLAVILGGGAGKRLFPLTMHRSKPAVPLGGKYRLIDIPVSNCINSDVSRIFVLTQYNSASLNRHIARTYQFDRFREGFVTVLAAEQTPESETWFQGTADAVRQSLSNLRAHRHSHVLILSGDQLYTMDYRKLMKHHLDSGAGVTLATIPVHAEEAPSFGIVKTEDGFITAFHEKPAPENLAGKESPVSEEMRNQGRTFLASMGIYMFDAEVLQTLLAGLPDANDFGQEIIPEAIRKHPVASYAFEGYWSDVGTVQSFFQANLMLAKRHPQYDIYNTMAPLYTNTRMLAPAKVLSSCIEDSLIGEAAVIDNSRISNSVIGIRSYIGAGTTVENTVFMGADYYAWHDPRLRSPVGGPPSPGIGDGSYIEGAIVDRNVQIGKRCDIRRREGVLHVDAENYFVRDGIVVIPKNAHIPDDTVI